MIHFMRLSLMKGAHADLSSTAWQEIGVKPALACPGVPWGLSGIPKHSTRFFLVTREKPRDLHFYQPLANSRWMHRHPFVIPSAAEGSAVRPGSRTKVSVPLVLPQNRHPERL